MFLRIVFGEIRHRRLSFLTGVLSVAAAVGCVVGALNLLESYDIQTDRIVARKEEELRERVRKLEDDYRKITKRMGFNVLILPKKQDLGQLWAQDFASAYMPEGYASRLGESKIMTVRHLLPSLQEKLFWPEQKRDIILIGIRGEIPLMHRKLAKPVLKPVKPGTVVVGHALHAQLGLSKGETVSILGQEFTVSECLPQRGSKDDITMWIDLEQAQEMLNKRGLINAIWALECRCAWADLTKVRSEITRILPETQVIEKASEALARAEARVRAEEEGKALVLAEKKSRERMRREKEQFAAVLAPVVIVAAGLWVGFLAFGNVRHRRSEIGILRAIGVGSGKILAVFLARAGMLGLLGAPVGFFAGLAAVSRWSVAGWWKPATLGVTLLAALALTGIASWLPALLAAGQDPADVMREG